MVSSYLMHALGIDIGGSGIKGCIVDVTTGELVAPRHRIETPVPATPEAITEVLDKIVAHFKWKGRIGCTFPGVIRRNTIYTAVNMDESCVGFNLGEALSRHSQELRPSVLNDADAAGYAEMRLGAGQGKKGVVMMLTIGTGIGSALFSEGRLVPNTELGHIEFEGEDAETQISDAARKRRDLSRKKWAREFNDYLRYLEALFWPELFIIGGGGAKKPEKFDEVLDTRTEIVYARFRNNSGIIGAALAAVDGLYLE